MKKIMFNDKYGLTQAVLEGRKTMTRRICFPIIQDFLNKSSNGVLLIPEEKIPCGMSPREFLGVWILDSNKLLVKGEAEENHEWDMIGEAIKHSPYRVGEEVAIAQSYSQASDSWNPDFGIKDECVRVTQQSPGWTNKMFVRAYFMPHRIRITGIKVERLQDISDEDCLREGVEKWIDCYIVSGIMENQGKNNVCFDTPREAFAALIDRVSGRGTWDSNPWVFAYTFELIK